MTLDNKDMEPFGIFSSEQIKQDQLASFIEGLGGEILSNEQQFRGLLSREACHLWIYISPELEVTSEEEILTLTSILGAEPHTCIVVEMSSAQKVEQLALEFIENFAFKWSAVVSNFNGEIFTPEQLKEDTFVKQLSWYKN